MRTTSKKRVKSQEISRLFAFLERMLDAGLSSFDLIRALGNLKGSRGLREAIRKIVTTIEDGGSLSEGMIQSPNVFSSLYVHIVRAGELSGRLPEALSRVKIHLDRAMTLRRKVRAATIYPLCVISTAALVSSLLVIFIIPSFRELFSDLETPLPWLTRVVIEVSETSLRWAPVFFIILSSFCFIVSRFFSTARGRETLDSLLLQAPLVGSIINSSALARLCRTLGSTLDAGMPILSALDASAQATGNRVIQRKLVRVRSDIAEGISISHSLNTSKLFPSNSIEMLELGERTGAVVTMLENIAEQLEEDAETSLTLMTQLAEPALVVILGVVIGTLVVAMYLPIFSMGELFS